ncbi:MAG TPA: DUF3106 domain-containing protein [Candidatus Binatia bacterium]|nr:DUF3106 domain-containing protein [Candidatus Binatia bacterium]
MFKKILRLLVIASVLLLPLAAWAADSSDNWRNLSPQEKERVQRNIDRWKGLPPKDKEYLQEEWDRWRRLPENRRDKLRERYDDLQRSR